jgi:hypothetical protein
MHRLTRRGGFDDPIRVDLNFDLAALQFYDDQCPSLLDSCKGGQASHKRAFSDLNDVSDIHSV